MESENYIFKFSQIKKSASISIQNGVAQHQSQYASTILIEPKLDQNSCSQVSIFCKKLKDGDDSGIAFSLVDWKTRVQVDPDLSKIKVHNNWGSWIFDSFGNRAQHGQCIFQKPQEFIFDDQVITLLWDGQKRQFTILNAANNNQAIFKTIVLPDEPELYFAVGLWNAVAQIYN